VVIVGRADCQSSAAPMIVSFFVWPDAAGARLSFFRRDTI